LIVNGFYIIVISFIVEEAQRELRPLAGSDNPLHKIRAPFCFVMDKAGFILTLVEVKSIPPTPHTHTPLHALTFLCTLRSWC